MKIPDGAVYLILAASLTAGIACQSGNDARTEQPPTGPPAESAERESELTKTTRRLLGQLRRDPEDEDAIGALAALGEAALPTLREGLKDPDEELRFAVVQALRPIPGKDALEAILLAFRDPDEDIRFAAAEALGSRRDPRAVPALLERYRIDDDAQVRYEILTTLGFIGDPATVPLLIGETSSDDPYVRQWAADALCVMKAPEAVDIATKLLGDSNKWVRKRVLEACGESLTGDDAQAGIINLAIHGAIFEESAAARRNLQKSLATPKAEDLRAHIKALAVPALDGDDALQAALVLADMDDPRGMDKLRKNYAHPDQFVRHHVAFELGRLSGAKSIPVLVTMLEDPVGLVAATAYDSLLNFADNGNEEAKKAVASYRGETFPTRLKDLAAAQAANR